MSHLEREYYMCPICEEERFRGDIIPHMTIHPKMKIIKSFLELVDYYDAS